MLPVPMMLTWLDRPQPAAWVRVAALLELLPGVLDGQPRRDADLMLFEYFVLTMLSEAPGHAANVRQHVIDVLSPEQVAQLTAIADAILGRLDPSGTMAATYQRYGEPPKPKSRKVTRR
jgi:hypothetical protein